MSDNEVSLVMLKIRDGLLELTHNHECEDHGGQPCWYERAAKLGYLAHALGIRGDYWKLVQAAASRYDHNCPGDHHG